MDSDKISQSPPMIHKKHQKLTAKFAIKRAYENINHEILLAQSATTSNPGSLGTSAASRLKRMLKVGSG